MPVAAILAPERLLFRLVLSERCFARGREGGFAGTRVKFIPAINARRFDARVHFSAERKRWEYNRAAWRRIRELENKM